MPRDALDGRSDAGVYPKLKRIFVITHTHTTPTTSSQCCMCWQAVPSMSSFPQCHSGGYGDRMHGNKRAHGEPRGDMTTELPEEPCEATGALLPKVEPHMSHHTHNPPLPLAKCAWISKRLAPALSLPLFSLIPLTYLSHRSLSSLSHTFLIGLSRRNRLSRNPRG